MSRDLNIERDHEEDLRFINKTDQRIYVLIWILLALTPIVMQLHIAQFNAPTMSSFSVLESGETLEFYAFYKWLILIIGTSSILLLFLYKLTFLDYRINLKSPINIIVLLTITYLSITYPFTSQGNLTMIGTPQRYEGLITYLFYLVLFLVIYNTYFTKEQIGKFILALYPVTIINFFTLTLTYSGIDLIEQKWFSYIVTMIEATGETVSNNTQVLTTLYNQNMMSGLAAALFFIFFLAALKETRRGIVVSHSIMALLAFSMLFTTLSASGFVTFAIISVLLFGLLIKRIVRNKKAIVMIAGAAVLFVSVFMLISSQNDRVEREVTKAYDEITGVFSIADMPTNEDLKTPDSILPEIPQRGTSWGSGRGYIWVETTEMIMDKPLIGYGFDTMGYKMNQHSLEKMSNFNRPNKIIDKSHNWYLALAYSGGVPLLLLMLTLIFWPFVQLIKQNIKQRDKSLTYELIYAVGLLAILTQWLVNDSRIGVAVIFWTLLGVLASRFNQVSPEQMIEMKKQESSR